ncbi:MAG TPA: hypothetical protein VED40_23375 [Azospirillaceae bacterium]|nr:hypothetical protein [Azospirillaceae bacterium]
MSSRPPRASRAKPGPDQKRNAEAEEALRKDAEGLRLRMGLTKTAFAKAVGVSQPGYSNFARRARRFPQEALPQLQAMLARNGSLAAGASAAPSLERPATPAPESTRLHQALRELVAEAGANEDLALAALAAATQLVRMQRVK